MCNLSRAVVEKTVTINCNGLSSWILLTNSVCKLDFATVSAALCNG